MGSLLQPLSKLKITGSLFEIGTYPDNEETTILMDAEDYQPYGS